MDIVVISQYLRNIDDFENNNSRFVYLAKMLAEKNKVEIVTSDFNHAQKAHSKNVGVLEDVVVTAIYEPGYPKNVCLRRFYSHAVLARNIAKYLSNRKCPDLCYCAIPSLDVAWCVARYCRENNIRFVIDIQDLWPEAFKMVFRIPILTDMLLAPMKSKADKIYAMADEIVAVSETYASRAMCANKKCKRPIVAYLGTEKEMFDSYITSAGVKNDGITVGYVGSMSESYDLMSVIDAIAQIKMNDTAVRLLAIGDGASRKTFADYAVLKGVNAEFTGKLPYPQMVERLMTCDIAVNPIRKGSAGSIINKVGDYAMAGLPVVNTQECSEYRELLDNYQAGINCECENSQEVAAALSMLITDEKLRKNMANNSRRLGEERFDRKNTYCKIIQKLSIDT